MNPPFVETWADLGRFVNAGLAALVVVLMVWKIKVLWPHLSVRIRDYWWALFLGNVTVIYGSLEQVLDWDTDFRIFLVTLFIALTLKGVLGRRNGILAADVLAIDQADVVRGVPPDTRLSDYPSGKHDLRSGLHSADAGRAWSDEGKMIAGERQDMYWDPVLGQWRMNDHLRNESIKAARRRDEGRG